ncbi:MAG: bactofilin family protein [Patescibacteria group bacterium]
MPLFGSMPSDANSANSPQNVNPPKITPPVPGAKMPATVIAKGVRLEGEFKSQGDVLIEGEVIGTIETNALLTIGPEADVKAGVTANNAEIAGRIDGNIKVSNRLEVKSTANIKGDITCQIIVVEAGAGLKGQLSCAKESDSGVKSETKPEVNPPQTGSNSSSSPKSGS